jgi:5-methylcytosine-specific restriction enzyme subunit McrC
MKCIETIEHDRFPIESDLHDKLCLVKNKFNLEEVEAFDQQELNKKYRAGFIIGVDWLEEGKSILKIKPKIADIDFFKMLDVCLKYPRVSAHLSNTFTLYDTKSKVPVDKDSCDILNVFLLLMFLRTVDKICSRGLKRDYVSHTDNLNNKIKGRILVQQTIKKNHFKANLNKTICTFSEYSRNCIENRILASTLDAINSHVNAYGDGRMANILAKVRPCFNNVERINLSPRIFKSINNTSFYKDYKQAIKLAEQIYNSITHTIRTEDEEKTYIFPFTIDMPELFERYCEALLRDRYGDKVQAGYGREDKDSETRAGRMKLRPDFYVDAKYIVDAKYKLQYYNGYGLLKEDAAQMSLYLHYTKILEKMKLADGDKASVVVLHLDNNGNVDVDMSKKTSFDGFIDIYKIGIDVPRK